MRSIERSPIGNGGEPGSNVTMTELNLGGQVSNVKRLRPTPYFGRSGRSHFPFPQGLNLNSQCHLT